VPGFHEALMSEGFSNKKMINEKKINVVLFCGWVSSHGFL